MQKRGIRYAVYILMFLVLAALCAFVWLRVSEIQAVQDYFDALRAHVLRQVTEGMVGAGNARREYLLLAWTLPSVLCAAVLILGSRLLERLLLGRAAGPLLRARPYSRAVSALSPLVIYFLMTAIRSTIVHNLTDARVIAQLGLAEPRRYVVTTMADGDTVSMPAYLVHPNYEAFYSAEYPAVLLTYDSWAWVAGAALIVLADFGYRLYQRIHAEKRAQISGKE